MNIVKQKGFTIIEVVLVLAIASLIFLMVFLALPALQSGQRDTDRKNDVSKVLAAVTTYQSNNNGTSPSGTVTLGSTTGFGAYLALSGNTTAVTITAITGNITPVAPSTGTIQLYTNAKCSTTLGSILVGNSPKQSAALTKLEGGNSLYCLNS